MAGEASPRGVSAGAHPHTTCTRRIGKATAQELPDSAAAPLWCCKTNGATRLFICKHRHFVLFTYPFVCFAVGKTRSCAIRQCHVAADAQNSQCGRGRGADARIGNSGWSRQCPRHCVLLSDSIFDSIKSIDEINQ